MAQAEFKRLWAELSAYGFSIDPSTELREGQGLLCYYDLQDGHIYLSLPNPSTPLGLFQAALFRDLLCCADDAELEELIRLHLPWLLAHELGHYLRHRAGLFGDDLWREEQIANQLAAALVEHRLSEAERRRWAWMLRRAIEHLAAKVGAPQAAVASFFDPLQSLGAAGMLRRATVRGLELIREIIDRPVEQILRDLPTIPPEILSALDQRRPTIDLFNTEYSASLARYIYLQYSWILLELQTPEHHYVDAVAQAHLGTITPLLPLVSPGPATDAQIAACHRAAAQLSARHTALSRYFARRYRTLLLARIQADPVARPINEIDLRHLMDGGDDDLDLLWVIAPPGLRHLFPAGLDRADAAPPDPALDLGPALPDPVDARLYALAPPPGAPAAPPDPAAANTLRRLMQMETSPIFRDLSAELLLNLTHHMHRVHLPAGEVLIQQGSENDDVFLLLSGSMELTQEREGALHRLGALHPGEVIGELAFLSGGRRALSVRAAEPSELLVIRAASLQLLAYAHPAILFRMGRVLAERLAHSATNTHP